MLPLSGKAKKILKQRVFRRLFSEGRFAEEFSPGILCALADGLRRKKLGIDKLLWRVMSDSAWYPDEHYDLAVLILKGGAAYYVHDHVRADKKMTFLHVDYRQAGYMRQLDQIVTLIMIRFYSIFGGQQEFFVCLSGM